MKNTLNIVIMDEEELNTLKKRIHNQRKVINHQKDNIKLLKKDNDSLSVGMQDATDDNADYEDTIQTLAVKYNKLAKENDDLQKLNNKLKQKLVAVNHAVNGKLHVALR